MLVCIFGLSLSLPLSYQISWSFIYLYSFSSFPEEITSTKEPSDDWKSYGMKSQMHLIYVAYLTYQTVYMNFRGNATCICFLVLFKYTNYLCLCIHLHKTTKATFFTEKNLNTTKSSDGEKNYAKEHPRN